MNLTERGYSFTASAERVIARDVKENRSYNGLDLRHRAQIDSRISQAEDLRYALPDRNIISVGVSIALKYGSSQVSLAKSLRNQRHFSP